jgi:hypothetical protein
MADVRFLQATKFYASSDTPAVDALDLHVEDGDNPAGLTKVTLAQ